MDFDEFCTKYRFSKTDPIAQEIFLDHAFREQKNPQIKFVGPLRSPDAHILMDPEEQSVLVEYAAKSEIVVEIGSYRGGSAEIMAPVCKKLICVDPFEMDTSIEWYKALNIQPEEILADFLKVAKRFPNIIFYKMTSFLASTTVLKNMKFDMVFVDGDHSFKGCLLDLAQYGPKTKKFILVHDYSTFFGGVIAACQTYFGRLPDALVSTLAVYRL
jgi:hypothetical protein